MSEIVNSSIELEQPALEGTEGTTTRLKGLIDHKFEAHNRDAMTVHHVSGSREGYRHTQVLYLRRLGGLSLSLARLERHLNEDDEYVDYSVDYWRRNFSGRPSREVWSPGFSLDKDGNILDRHTGEPAKPMKKAILYTRILFGRPDRRR